MQFNVLQWQAFHMYQYPYTDSTNPSLMHKLIQTGACKGPQLPPVPVM